MFNFRLPLLVFMFICFSQSANALNILLTNDDSYATENIQTLFSRLEQAGHSVLMSAPCTGQSGKGGALNGLVGVTVTSITEQQVCVGDTDETVAFEDFVEGTPVMAVLYGLDVLALNEWGQLPDLVISGPNEGNNLGYIVTSSGTVSAANAAISRGVPTIAISAHADEENPDLVADVVLNIVAKLEEKRRPGKKLLPRFTGLNVNTPEDLVNNKGFAFSRVGWSADGLDVKFVADLSQDPVAVGLVTQSILESGVTDDPATAQAFAIASFEGKGGITLDTSGELYQDTSRRSEGNLIGEGYITISTIEGNPQATRAKSAWVRFKLNSLVAP